MSELFSLCTWEGDGYVFVLHVGRWQICFNSARGKVANPFYICFGSAAGNVTELFCFCTWKDGGSVLDLQVGRWSTWKVTDPFLVLQAGR